MMDRYTYTHMYIHRQLIVYVIYQCCVCYWTQVQLLKSQSFERQVWIDRKYALIRKANNLRRRWICPETNSEDSAWPRPVLKGEMGKNLSESIRAGCWVLIILHCVNISSDVILPAWSACWVAKGAAGVES